MILRAIAFALLALLAGACGGASVTAARQSSGPAIVELATVRQQVAGRPVVYLFTAPGCASCADQAGVLADAAQGKPSIRLVGVDLSNDRPGDFAAYINAIGLGQSRFVWTIDRDAALAREYGITSLSSTVFVGSDGRVRYVNSGPADAATLAGQVRQLG